MSPTFAFTVRLGQDARPTAAQAEQQAARAASAADQARANAEQARANADRFIDQTIRDADRAVQGGEPATAPLPPLPPPPGGEPVVFTTDNGRPVSISFKDGTVFLTQDGNTQQIPLREAIPREAAQIAWAVPATLSILLIWWPISRAVIRWLNRKHAVQGEAAALEARLRDRMDALERNVDTVAVEMERLSEGQRFTNKLLADRAEQGERVPVSGQR